MNGRAGEFVQQMLPMYVTEEALGKVGVHRIEERNHFRPDGPVTKETRFYRPHREVDVTSYGDLYNQTMVVSPGLDVRVTGDQGEVDMLALLLIHQGILNQLDSETKALALAHKETTKEMKKVSERESALLSMWDGFGKKRRANLMASDPKVAALCEKLEEEREHERRMDAEGYDY
jgi:hypothetical protein